MQIDLWLDEHPPGPCRSWRHHVHADITRTRNSPDPRVPGRSRHEDLLVTRAPDALSPHLLQAAASGRWIGRVTLRARASDDAPTFSIELTDVLVTSVLCSVEDGVPLETVAFSYGRVAWSWGEDPPTAWSVYEARP